MSTHITGSYPVVYHEQQHPGTGTEAVRAHRSTEHRARAVDREGFGALNSTPHSS